MVDRLPRRRDLHARHMDASDRHVPSGRARTATDGRPRRPSRIKTFADRVRWLGPVVWMLSVSYFVTQIIVSLAFKPEYSWFTNSISDLGNTHCDPARLCSPRHDWMNAQFIVLGGVMA